MHRCLVILLGIDLAAPTVPLAAQTWNDAPTRSLVARAIGRRRNGFADSTLRAFAARAHGVVTFRAELGPDLALPPRPVRADEIAVEVYWQRPDRSKQIIRAWRDTTLVPTELGYHRDHLGIAIDDFGPTIRLGDGAEVADVIHPLAPDGPARYDYRLGDTVVIASGRDRLVLVAIDVRPKDLGEPGVVGTLFLDRGRAELVRSQLTFTPAAYRDRELEDIVVRLERSLIENRYWLPHTQAIEIRRRSAVVDFPLRGVIRGDWTIGEYQLNPELGQVSWGGPPIGGLRHPEPGGDWPTPLATVVDSSLRPWSRQQLAAVRAAVIRVAKSRIFDGLPRVGLSVTRVSDVVRFNRVQGLVLGAGLAWRGAWVDRFRVGLGYGFSDHRVVGQIEASRTVGGLGLQLRADRGVADVGEVELTSPLINSVAAQEWGRDHGDYLLIERVEAGATRTIGPSSRIALTVGREWATSVVQRARPSWGSSRPNPALGSPPQWIATARLETGRAGLRREGALRITAETASSPVGTYGRLAVFGQAALPLGAGTVGLKGSLGLATAGVPVRRSFAFGGVGSLVGAPFRGYGGRRAAWIAGEWLVPVPGPSLRLGFLGRTAPTIRVGPVVALGAAGGAIDGAPWAITSRVPIVAGLAFELFDRSLRVEVGQRLGGGWSPGFAIDLNRAWWPIL